MSLPVYSKFAVGSQNTEGREGESIPHHVYKLSLGVSKGFQGAGCPAAQPAVLHAGCPTPLRSFEEPSAGLKSIIEVKN